MRTFLIIYVGQAFSLLGTTAVSFALSWWLTIETGSALVLTYAAVAAFLPQTIIGPFVGPYIDRWDRRKTMIGADLTVALVSLVLIALFAVTTPSVATVIVFIGLRSVGSAFHLPASQAAIPMYVPQDELVRVAGWYSFLQSGTAIAGPVVGAFMMSVLSVSWALGVDVAGAVIASGLLLLVRIPHPRRREEDLRAGGVIEEMRLGWQELAGQRGLLLLSIVLAVAVFVYMPVGALFPLMTRRHFGGGAFQAGLIEVAFGIGMLVGGLAVGLLGKGMSLPRAIAAGVLLLGGTLVASGLLPPGAFPVFALVCVVMGLSVPFFSAPIQALFQALIDPAVLGRVSSLVGTMTLAATPIGLLAAGPLAQQVGVATWFTLSGIPIVAIGVFCLLSPTIRALALPETAVAAAPVVQAEEPAPPA